MQSLILAVFIGAGLGAALGYFGQCTDGTCPLTANWRRGALYGAVIGLAFHLASGGATSRYPTPKNIGALEESRFETDVLQSDKPVVLDFFATWCGPCKAMAPRLDALAAEYAPHIKFVQVNVDQAPALAQRFNVQSIPTLLFFAHGQVTDTVTGLASTEDLRSRLDRLNAQTNRHPAPTGPAPDKVTTPSDRSARS